MADIAWKTVALITGRKIKTRMADLATCVSEFMTMPEAQKQAAKITIPGCITLDQGNSIRTLSSQNIDWLANRLPPKHQAQTI